MLDGKGQMTPHINLAYRMKNRIDLGNQRVYKKQKSKFHSKENKENNIGNILYFDRYFITPNLFVPTGDVNL